MPLNDDFSLDLAQPEPHYFSMLSHLRILQEQVRQVKGLSARDLIWRLEHLALEAGFNPVGSTQEGKTPDVFFAAYPEIGQLESELTLKINPENVSEVLELIFETDFYKPTSKVLTVIQSTYLSQLPHEQ